ncbi:hypothetical protein Trydic_g953 [Trypoxylus dichotomus]
MLRVLMCTVLLSSIHAASRNTYKGWKLYRYWSPEHLVRDLSTLYENTENFDFWSVIREAGEPVDVAVREIAHPSFENILEKLNVSYQVQIEYIDKAFNREVKEMKAASNPEKGHINFEKYHRYNVILDYVKNLEKKHPGRVSIESIGKSVEEREIFVVKISSKTQSLKPAILVDAGLSPREWIGPAQALYIIQQFVENPYYKKMVENVDWYIIPVVNPDGYEYTHTKERLWKKNRAKNNNHTGVYLNRNFDINFGGDLSSSAEEAWNYHGKSAFSEPETEAIRRFIENNVLRIKLYLSLDSFGPAIVYPYGYKEDPPENIEIIKLVAENVAEQIRKENQTPYQVKRASSRHCKYSGTSVDWSVEVAGVPFAFTVELTTPGYLGFDFPTYRIKTVVQEFMTGLKVFYDFINDNFVIKSIKDAPKIEL